MAECYQNFFIFWAAECFQHLESSHRIKREEEEGKYERYDTATAIGDGMSVAGSVGGGSVYGAKIKLRPKRELGQNSVYTSSRPDSIVSEADLSEEDVEAMLGPALALKRELDQRHWKWEPTLETVDETTL